MIGGVIALRFFWVFAVAYLPALAPAPGRPAATGRSVALVAWTGMRGAVSLATALAIPLRDRAARRSPVAT